MPVFSAMSALAVVVLVSGITYIECVQPVERDRLIQEYFERGYSYRLDLCFLFALHGVNISLRTLKRHLQRLNLRRRGRHTSLSRVTRCLLVRISISARCIVARLCSYRLSCKVRGHSLDTGQCIRDCVADITLLFQGGKKCWSLTLGEHAQRWLVCLSVC